MQLVNGEVAIGERRFAPAKAFADRKPAAKGFADDFAAIVSSALRRVVKPCLAVMPPDQLELFRKNPKTDVSTARICGFTGSWSAFAKDYLAWAESHDVEEEAANSLNTMFRPLETLHYQSPLIWDNDSLDADAGTILFHVADLLDPRTDSTFQIEIADLQNGAEKDRRVAEIRRQLNPLRNSVFCPDRVRAAILDYYRKRGMSPRIEKLDPQGVLVVIREAP